MINDNLDFLVNAVSDVNENLGKLLKEYISIYKKDEVMTLAIAALAKDNGGRLSVKLPDKEDIIQNLSLRIAYKKTGDKRSVEFEIFDSTLTEH